MHKKAMTVTGLLAGLFLAYAAVQLHAKDEKGKSAPDRSFTVVNVEYEGTKIWLPSVLIVKKGERVKLNFINNAPSGTHGFTIDEFKVQLAVNKGEKPETEFVADKAGLFRIYCHLHPAHLGGQLLVLK